jgi:ABC-type dipeptide/oligopeptide/nickel transport system ATPase subunit
VAAPLIVVSNLEKTYRTKGRALVRALGGISLEVAEGEFITIVGQSGCGKRSHCCWSGHLVPLWFHLTRIQGSLHEIRHLRRLARVR